mgnify:CR=1 FL=1
MYIRSVSGSSVAVRVSTDGGDFPFWGADGRELYYRAPDGAIMAVGVKLGPTVTAAAIPSVRKTIGAVPAAQRLCTMSGSSRCAVYA